MGRWGSGYGKYPKSQLHEYHQAMPVPSFACPTPDLHCYRIAAVRALRCQTVSWRHRWWRVPCPMAPCTESQRLQQVHGGTPVSAIEDGPPPPASPSFTCHLTIPALSTPHGGYEETSFTAVARSKKAAEHAAAEKALGFIAAQGLLPLPTPAPVPVQGLNVSVDEARSASPSCVCIGLMLQASDTRNVNAEAVHYRFGAIARERVHRDTVIGLLPGKRRTAPPLHGLASAGLGCWPLKAAEGHPKGAQMRRLLTHAKGWDFRGRLCC